MAEVAVSAVVVSYGTRELTLAAVQSLLRFLPPHSDIWVIDNASVDGSAQAVAEFGPPVHVLPLGENVGFGRANNLGIEYSDGEFILLLNSDARLVNAQTVQRLVATMRAEPDLGIVGPRLENAAGDLEYSARAFPTLGRELVRRFGLYLLFPRARVGRWLLGDLWSPREPTRVDWVTGACMLVRRSAVQRVGGFDPRIFMYGEEQEWCRRLQADGWRVLYDPREVVVHERAASGSAGPWRAHAALLGDARIFRWNHGMPKTFALNVIRVLGFAAEAAAFSVRCASRPSEYSRSRRDGARTHLVQQLRVIARHPFG